MMSPQVHQRTLSSPERMLRIHESPCFQFRKLENYPVMLPTFLAVLRTQANPLEAFLRVSRG